jgi:tetratricopeptide (TPR) repeat protein
LVTRPTAISLAFIDPIAPRPLSIEAADGVPPAVSVDSPRIACLQQFYHEYLAAHDGEAYLRKVTARYTPATLERLALTAAPRLTRRGAVLALGLLQEYQADAALSRALHDEDRGVRMLAENGLRAIWCRAAGPGEQQQLTVVIRLNVARHFLEAIRRASELINQAPRFAEIWNQRAIALYSLGRYRESIQDCRQTLELNQTHFGAAAGMGQCHLQLGDEAAALQCFRRALALNPDLEGIRANVALLERKLKKKET